MFRSQRGPDPFVGEGRLESLLHGPFRRFVLSLSLSSLSLPFMIRFYLSSNPKVWFTMVPYAVCGLGIVVRPTLFVPPSASRCFFLPFLPSRIESRRTTTNGREREREMKNRRCASPPFLWNRFFRPTVTERCLSFDELASSDLFAPLRYQSLPLVRSRSWADIIRKLPANQRCPAFPFHGGKVGEVSRFSVSSSPRKN